jgi:hypothetical protein
MAEDAAELGDRKGPLSIFYTSFCPSSSLSVYSVIFLTGSSPIDRSAERIKTSFKEQEQLGFYPSRGGVQ